MLYWLPPMAKQDATTRVCAFEPSDALTEGSMPCLETLSGNSAGRLVTLQEGANLIGRGVSCQIVLSDDGVSRCHAEITVSEDGIVTLADLKSTNGTLVNGARVNRIGLREGDRIQVGPAVAYRFGYRALPALRSVEAAAPETPVAHAPPSIPLTPRELDVARLVATGLSNDEIAGKLFISTRTVGTHLTNIYKRLEIHTRAELTRLVVERGLLSDQ